jgi:hypothetical protein
LSRKFSAIYVEILGKERASNDKEQLARTVIFDASIRFDNAARRHTVKVGHVSAGNLSRTVCVIDELASSG